MCISKCVLGKWPGIQFTLSQSCPINVKTSAVENGTLKRIPEGFPPVLFTRSATMQRRENAGRKSADYTYIWERQTEGGGQTTNNGREAAIGKTCL